jgi:hypothetical protein
MTVQKDDNWLDSADDSPAGPLFSGGAYAEADIVGSAYRNTMLSICTGSVTIACC